MNEKQIHFEGKGGIRATKVLVQRNERFPIVPFFSPISQEVGIRKTEGKKKKHMQIL